MEGPNPPPPNGDAPDRARVGPAIRRFYRWWTPVRLVAAALVALAIDATVRLGPEAVLVQLLLLPPIAVAADLGMGALRHRSFRFPWSGFVTGLFVALLLPPQGLVATHASVLVTFAASSLTVLAILAKYLLRVRGHPLFNPAALAMVGAAALFGIIPAWWGSIDLVALVVVGVLVAARQWRRAGAPIAFFAVFAALVSVDRVVLLNLTDPHLLLLSILDPSLIFFTLLMVPEPRSGPSAPILLPVYGAAVAVVAIVLGFLVPANGTVLSAVSLPLALLLGNLVALGMRLLWAPSAERSRTSSRAAKSVRRAGRPSLHWGWAEQGLTVFLALVLLAVTVGLVPPPPAASTSPPKVVVVSCTQDNRTISSSDLQMLHQRLGPSVIFSYDPATGATVFYDPANHVTVYETDLFEDYGLAEFNGDDAILSQGCTLSSGGGAGGA